MKLYIAERRRVVAHLHLFDGTSFREIAEQLPKLGFRKVRFETCWDDYQAFVNEIGQALNTAERAGEIIAEMQALVEFAVKAHKTAVVEAKTGRLLPDGQAQAALLGRAHEALESLAKICGILKPEQYEHKHSGTLSIIDEIADAERAIGKVKSLPGVR